jgi:hypothetical protein
VNSLSQDKFYFPDLRQPSQLFDLYATCDVHSIIGSDLEAALQNDWSLTRYDILPDRIVLYMWSRAGGTKFNFKFRPRYGINAQTPASIVYDYYNPEAQATVAPLRFATR